MVTVRGRNFEREDGRTTAKKCHVCVTSVVEPRSHARSRKLFQMFMISQNHLYSIYHGQPIVPCTLCHFPLWLMKPKAALEKGFIFLRPWWGLASREVPEEVRMEKEEDGEIMYTINTRARAFISWEKAEAIKNPSRRRGFYAEAFSSW